MESLAALPMLILLLLVERFVRRVRGGSGAAVVFPLFMALYGLYRLIFDHFRELPGSRWIWLLASFAGLLWLAFSVIRLFALRRR